MEGEFEHKSHEGASRIRRPNERKSQDFDSKHKPTKPKTSIGNKEPTHYRWANGPPLSHQTEEFIKKEHLDPADQRIHQAEENAKEVADEIDIQITKAEKEAESGENDPRENKNKSSRRLTSSFELNTRLPQLHSNFIPVSEMSSPPPGRSALPSPDNMETIPTPASSPMDASYGRSSGLDLRNLKSSVNSDGVEQISFSQFDTTLQPMIHRNFAATAASITNDAPIYELEQAAEDDAKLVSGRVAEAEAEALVGRAALEQKPLPAELVEAVQGHSKKVLSDDLQEATDDAKKFLDATATKDAPVAPVAGPSSILANFSQITTGKAPTTQVGAVELLESCIQETKAEVKDEEQKLKDGEASAKEAAIQKKELLRGK